MREKHELLSDIIDYDAQVSRNVRWIYHLENIIEDVRKTDSNNELIQELEESCKKLTYEVGFRMVNILSCRSQNERT